MIFYSLPKLNSLSLTIYGFHLSNALNYGKDPLPEADLLWTQLTKLGDQLNIPELSNITKKLVCYEDDQYKPKSESQEEVCLLHPSQGDALEFSIPLLEGIILDQKPIKTKCTIIPYLLHDTYALDLTLQPEVPIYTTQLNPLNLSNYLEPSLGQSMLLYAEPAISDDYSELANTCIKQIFPELNNIKLIAQGTLLKYFVFVYSNNEIDPSKHQNIIIWFNINPPISEKIVDVNIQLLFLLFSWHKILYAYHQSRYTKTKLQELYPNIEQQVNNFSQTNQSNNRLQEFKQLLIQLPQQSLQYSQLLRELSDHQNTIKTNELNFRRSLAKIEQLPDSDTSWLKIFLDKMQIFQQQITTDLSFLSPSKMLFDELINNIRSITAIDQIQSDQEFQLNLQEREKLFDQQLYDQEQERLEQLRVQDNKSAERDKKNELLITFFGTALAVSGISAGVIDNPTENILHSLSINPPTFYENRPLLKFFLNSSLDVIFHIIIGLMVAIPVYRWFKNK